MINPKGMQFTIKRQKEGWLRDMLYCLQESIRFTSKDSLNVGTSEMKLKNSDQALGTESLNPATKHYLPQHELEWLALDTNTIYIFMHLGNKCYSSKERLGHSTSINRGQISLINH